MAAPAKSVAEASKGLEAARKKLTDAVAKIQTDPPATADLEAAHQAVENLKNALDSGVSFETADLEYAKAVLAARKELRTQREYVDDRRAKIQVHEARRKLDAALGPLNDEVKRLNDDKDPGDKEFDEARAKLAAVKKAAEESRNLTKLDPGFATFVGTVDATVAKQDKAIGDKWIAVSADKQRGKLDESRKALQTALAELAKGWSDPAFDASSKAVAALEKRLDEGRPLEPGDKTYRGEAEKARAEVSAAKKKLEEAVTAAGVQRIKNEIDPAFVELKTAAKNLRARRPSPEQLTEAKTAAFVVSKSMEKYQSQAGTPGAIGTYLGEVQKTLVEVEVQLQIRSLDAARADLKTAVRNLGKRDVSDEMFDEAKAAVNVLEKTLETVHAKDPAIAPYVFDAKKEIKDSKAEIELRRYQVELGRALKKVKDTTKDALTAVTKVQREKPDEAGMKAAEDAVKQIQVVLDENQAFVKKDRDYAALAKESKEKIFDYNGRIAQRKVQLTAIDTRAKITELIATAKSKIETSKRSSGTDADLAASLKAVEDVNAALEANAGLVKQDVMFASYADKASNEWIRLMEQQEVARQQREVRKATGDQLDAANKALAAADATKDMKKRKELLETAQSKLKACQDEGPKLLKDTPKLSNLEVLVGETASTPREVIVQCVQKTEALQEPLKDVVARIRFDDGPKKAYEAAKYLLSQSRKDEAVAQLNECISTGKITENRHPEYKDTKRDVAGAQMTVGELVAACSKERKALTGK